MLHLSTLQCQALEKAMPVRWQPNLALVHAPAGAWRSWLQERGSLTQRLQQQARSSFHVELLQQRLVHLRTQELAQLGWSRQPVLVRQVLLHVDQQPWVYARSLLPLVTSAPLYRRVRHLGNQALGQLLFSSADLQRGTFSYCAPHQLAFPSLWGRQSVFYQQQACVLVAEHFLPPMARALNLASHSLV
ncbi:chorismate--pyruvate lyase family protein [Marinospirillum sp.]|uniref:chorismate--pyruvate lyase family protein n=1 Tax=Marinospirillum sp. TaxID=2183934 RepID=UPI003A882B42